MNKWKCQFLLIGFQLVLTSVVYAKYEDVKQEDDVLILTDSNFQDVVNGEPIMLVEFYAPWCGHCQTLAPEYSKAASTLKTAKVPVPLAKVDATVETELAKQYEVNSYPTLYVFRHGEKEEYDGGRDAMGIINFMKERSDSSWKPPPSAVLTLTSINFTSYIEGMPLVLVEFYAPWCGHCKRLAPEYEKAAVELKSSIPLVKVDGVAEMSLSETYKVHGWPTLLIFRKEKSFEYKGPRTASGIVEHMRQQIKLPSTEVFNVNQAKNAFNKIDITIFGIFSKKNEFFEEYITAANNLREKFTFLHTFDSTLGQNFKLTLDAIAVDQPEIFHSAYEKTQHILDTPTSSAADIESFINKHTVPLVGHRTKENDMERYTSKPLLVVYYDVNFDFQHRVATQFVRKKVVEVARDFPSVTFCISQESDFEDELVKLGLDESGSDINVGFYDAQSKRYAMEPDDDFDADVLREFVDSVSKGKVKAKVISQPIPPTNDAPVKIVVANSFEDMVETSKEDVIIEFYAPWCGHCKALEPVYTKLAKKMSDRQLIVAKMDASANDIPYGYKVTGFPTIYFVPADKKNEPVLFEGADRNIKTLIEFVDKYSHFKPSSREKEEL